ncbi:MAG: UDP-N-acetylmuramate dehydrogenase [Planctomycetaceae bacterium]|nr:UDP-N-acetylmuramate dehydrogenase [Planctomycetaceae bacterium]
MSLLDSFADIVRQDEPLAPHTWLGVGGPAQYFIQPRTQDELVSVVKTCVHDQIPIRILGSGSNVIVRDEGIAGAVIQIEGNGFSQITTEGTRIRAGAGALLSNVISHAVKSGLAGMEVLVGIPGTVGGALKGNAGGKSGDIGQFVRSVRALTDKGEIVTRTEDELSFAYRTSSIDELVILDGEFELMKGDPDEITRRMRTIWIMKKATQPLTFQSAGCIFKNPRGLSAGALIEQAGLKGMRKGEAEISDRHGNFIVTSEGAKAADVLQLIELARSRVAEQFGVPLELEVQIW